MTDSTADEPASADSDADLIAFHDDLIALRAAAGAPSYARLARRIGQPRTTVYDAFRRPSLPSLELLTALVKLLGGDVEEWRSRWAELRARSDSSGAVVGDAGEVTLAPSPVEAPDSGPRTRSDGPGRRSNAKWWAAIVAVAVVVAGVTGVLTRLATTGSGSNCSQYRVYRVTSSGSLLNADSVEQGRTRAGDLILVSSTKDHTFHARYPSIDLASGKRGYVDQSRITFLRDSGCL